LKPTGAGELDSLPPEKEVPDRQISLDITETKTIILPLPSLPTKSDNEDKEAKSTPMLTTGTTPDDIPEPSDESAPSLGLHKIQPFVKGKTYRPIFFNPNNNQVAQFAN